MACLAIFMASLRACLELFLWLVKGPFVVVLWAYYMSHLSMRIKGFVT